jgi:hypothetical protein
MMMLLLGDEAALAWAVGAAGWPLRSSREGGSSAWLWNLPAGLGVVSLLEERAHGRAMVALGPETVR